MNRRFHLTPAPVIGMVTALVVVAGGTLGILAVRDALPERIAVHWGLNGLPDRWSDLTSTLLTSATLLFAITAAMVVLTGFLHRLIQPVLGAITTGMAVTLGVLIYAATISQAGTDGNVRIGPWLALGMVLGLAAGFVVYRTTWREPTSAEPEAGPEAAAQRLDAPAGARVAWIGHLGPSPRTQVLIAAAIIVAGALLAFFADPWLTVIPVALLGLVLAFTSATVTVDRGGVNVTSLGRLRLAAVPIARIHQADTVTVRPLADFGGWGWRIGLDGRQGFVTRGGEALRIERQGEPDLILTVADAGIAAATVNTLKDRSRA